MTSTLAHPPERVTTWRLGGRSRKTVLLHILAAGTWFGLDVAMAVLVFTAIFTESVEVRSHLAVRNFSNMLYPPIVSPTALIVAFLVAVFKPWGRIRRSRAGQGGRS
jgi:hypothetical protein